MDEPKHELRNEHGETVGTFSGQVPREGDVLLSIDGRPEQRRVMRVHWLVEHERSRAVILLQGDKEDVSGLS